MYYSNDKLVVTKVDKNKGGNGITKTTHITDTSGLCNKGRLYGVQELEPGCSVGSHIHDGDMEIYYFLEGAGAVTDDGVAREVKPGDVMITNEGHEHSLTNTGDCTLKWVSLILFV